MRVLKQERGWPVVAEILAVGTELLLGQIVNTNARFLAESLARLGIDVYYQTVVGDNLRRAAAAFRQALGRSDLVVSSGGLGPTEDDLTREAVADALGLPLEEDEAARGVVEAYLTRRGLPLSGGQRRQWSLPRGARALANEAGSAPGFIVEQGGKAVICLPGPPSELVPMFRRHVAPYLEARPDRGGVILLRVLHVSGVGEAAVEERVRDLLSGRTNPTVAPCARPGAVSLRITAKAADEATARAMIAPVEAAVRERLDPWVFGVDEETLEGEVGRLLRARGLTLALAESCTGGLIGHRITNIPGSSDYFLFGAVVYSNRAKEAILGVPGETLRRWGAVSRQTAVAMAEGVRRAGEADVGVATTGIAGPGGGTPEKPVGTVYFGLAAPEGAWWHHRVFTGERETIKQWAAQEALTLLRLYLAAPRTLDGFARRWDG